MFFFKLFLFLVVVIVIEFIVLKKQFSGANHSSLKLRFIIFFGFWLGVVLGKAAEPFAIYLFWEWVALDPNIQFHLGLFVLFPGPKSVPVVLRIAISLWYRNKKST
jgi:hypothetical protein